MGVQAHVSIRVQSLRPPEVDVSGAKGRCGAPRFLQGKEKGVGCVAENLREDRSDRASSRGLLRAA